MTILIAGYQSPWFPRSRVDILSQDAFRYVREHEAADEHDDGEHLPAVCAERQPAQAVQQRCRCCDQVERTGEIAVHASAPRRVGETGSANGSKRRRPEQGAKGGIDEKAGHEDDLRKWMIAAGLWIQAVGILMVVLVGSFAFWVTAATLMGLGTALVYPTLLAAISDVAHPNWRASSVGVYRLWRDSGYAIGALLSGVLADILGLGWAIGAIAGLTALSGLIVAGAMYETLGAKAVAPVPIASRYSSGRLKDEGASPK